MTNGVTVEYEKLGKSLIKNISMRKDDYNSYKTSIRGKLFKTLKATISLVLAVKSIPVNVGAHSETGLEIEGQFSYDYCQACTIATLRLWERN